MICRLIIEKQVSQYKTLVDKYSHTCFFCQTPKLTCICRSGVGRSAHTCRWGSKPIPLQHSSSQCMATDPQHLSVTVALPAGCIVACPSLSIQQREVEEFIYSWPQQTNPGDKNGYHIVVLGGFSCLVSQNEQLICYIAYPSTKTKLLCFWSVQRSCFWFMK